MGTPPAPVVRLRPARLDEVALLDAWAASPEHAGEFAHFGLAPHAYGSAVDSAAGTPPAFLVVEVRSELAGSVSWRAVDYGPTPGRVAWNIGIHLEPAFRGHGVGTRAQRSLADMLFATTAANRVEASTDVSNVAEQRALEKAGFLREGVARGAQWRTDGWHDLVVYARLRSD